MLVVHPSSPTWPAAVICSAWASLLSRCSSSQRVPHTAAAADATAGQCIVWATRCGPAPAPTAAAAVSCTKQEMATTTHAALPLRELHRHFRVECSGVSTLEGLHNQVVQVEVEGAGVVVWESATNTKLFRHGFLAKLILSCLTFAASTASLGQQCQPLLACVVFGQRGPSFCRISSKNCKYVLQHTKFQRLRTL
jgi:hypothetical protein